MARKKLKIPDRECQQRIFNENFSSQAYEDAVKSVMECLTGAHTPSEIGERMKTLENSKKCDWFDLEFEDFKTIIWCDIELDRSKMETEADYVGVHLRIDWEDAKGNGKILIASLFSTVFSKDYIADELCRFDPETFQIMEWLY